MNTNRILLCLLLMFSIFEGEIFGDLFDLTVEEILDSTSFIEKIGLSENPLYSYFFNESKPVTRYDIIAVINKKIIPTTDFAYNVTKFAELKSATKFEGLSITKKDEVMARNRDLLTELFPDEIKERKKMTLEQSFGLHIPVHKVDSILWLKAEVINFLNEVLGNQMILKNWENIRIFFSEDLKEDDIKAFVEMVVEYEMFKIPINVIDIRENGKSEKVDVFIKGKSDRKQSKLFTLSIVSEKRWKILEVKKICNNLINAGYLVNREVQ